MCTTGQANIRGRDVFVVQSTCTPVNANLIELTLILSACKRASARRVTAVAPYLGYSRMTRKAKSRVPVSAADVASLLEEACVDGLLTVDIHDDQIGGFYSPRCAFEYVSLIPTFARFLLDNCEDLRKPIVVAPHSTCVPRAMMFVEALRKHYAADAQGREPAANSYELRARLVDGEEADVDAEAVRLDELALRPLEVRPATIVCLER